MFNFGFFILYLFPIFYYVNVFFNSYFCSIPFFLNYFHAFKVKIVLSLNRVSGQCCFNFFFVNIPRVLLYPFLKLLFNNLITLESSYRFPPSPKDIRPLDCADQIVQKGISGHLFNETPTTA